MQVNIEQELKRLVGLSLTKATRIEGVQYLHFGKANVTTSSGLILDVGEYTLALSCIWRITEAGRAVVDFNDLYFAKDAAFALDFDWKVPGSTRRDQKLKELVEEESLTVTEVRSDGGNNVRVLFANGMVLEVQPQDGDTETTAEYWRFFSNVDQSYSLMARASGAELLDQAMR